MRVRFSAKIKLVSPESINHNISFGFLYFYRQLKSTDLEHECKTVEMDSSSSSASKEILVIHNHHSEICLLCANMTMFKALQYGLFQHEYFFVYVDSFAFIDLTITCAPTRSSFRKKYTCMDNDNKHFFFCFFHKIT